MIRPMLCKLAVKAHDDPGWVWERKYDGVRMLAIVGTDGSVRLQARSGADKTAQFPELLRMDVPRDSVLDGEVVSAADLSFQDFSQRRVNRAEGIAQAMQDWPARYIAFDALKLDGIKLDELALNYRRGVMHDRIQESDTLGFPEEGCSGTDLFWAAGQYGWEGVVGKRLTEPYLFGRRAWLKVKVWQEGLFQVTGYSDGMGRRFGKAGSFSLRSAEGKPVGSVGTGFDDEELRRLTSLMKTSKEPVWFRIKYAEATNDGQLRFPVYLGTVEMASEDPR